MKNLYNGVILIGALVLSGCGGGSASVEVGTPLPQFLTWIGSSGGIRVIDGPGNQFAFYADNGCLRNYQTGQENVAFCLAAGSNFVNYGAFHGQVLNVLVADGTCQAAIVDTASGNFVDIEVDQFGREVVLTTALRPAFCGR